MDKKEKITIVLSCIFIVAAIVSGSVWGTYSDKLKSINSSDSKYKGYSTTVTVAMWICIISSILAIISAIAVKVLSQFH